MKFKCAVCGEEFEAALTVEEALAQFDKEFPVSAKEVDPRNGEDVDVACDDCFKQMFPSGVTPEMEE